jgi:hypothetical protein
MDDYKKSQMLALTVILLYPRSYPSLNRRKEVRSEIGDSDPGIFHGVHF